MTAPAPAPDVGRTALAGWPAACYGRARPRWVTLDNWVFAERRGLEMRKLVGPGSAGLVVALLHLIAACGDSLFVDELAAPPPITMHPVNPIQIISVTPFRTENGRRVLACKPGEVPEGLALAFNLIGTGKGGSLGSNNDLQVREGDLVGGSNGGLVTVGGGASVRPDIFQVDLSCIEAYPDETSTCESDDGVMSPNSGVSEVELVKRSPSRTQPIAVAILVDHSSSTIGFGNQDRKEVKDDGFVVPGKFADPTHSRYRAAIDGIINLLNDNDLLIAYYFDEDGVMLACNAPGIDGISDEAQRERTCFGPQHDWVAGAIDPSDPTKILDGAFTDLSQGSILAKGRTPLWAAVDHAWSFLEESGKVNYDGNIVELAKHVVVITDSPDTCNPNSPAYLPDEPCSSVSYDDFRARVEAVPLEQRIPVSFVQLQSYGYPEQDPAQMEAACLTGGTYQWVNRLELADTSDQLETALREALSRIRYTFGGVWRLYIDTPVLYDPDADKMLPPGRVFAIDGEVTVKPSIVAAKERTFTFKYSEPNDNRLPFRRMCTAESQCPGGADGDCFVSCNPQGSVCAWPFENAHGTTLQGIPVGDGGSCTMPDTTGGTCCCGTCQATDATCMVKEGACCDSNLDQTCTQ